jgi:exodeoxyribonuclease VII small subunit
MSGKEPKAGEDPSDEPGLEGRIRRLEEILARMEADDVSLEEALGLFEEGVAHVRRAEAILAATELRVEELLSGDETKPMELDEP